MVDKTKKSDDLFFEIFYSNPIGMIISNLETTKFKFVNEIFLKSFGYKKAEVIGKTALDLKLIEPDFNKKILSQLQLQGFAKDIEVLGRKKTGETFWTLASVKVITINDEKFAITSFLNITERKKAEDKSILAIKELAFQNEEKEKRAAELIVANKELEFQNKEKEKRAAELGIANNRLLRSEDFIKKLNQELEQKVTKRSEQLQLINKNISDYKFALDESCIVAVTNQKGTIQFVNDNFCKISKYTKAELIGQDHRIINSNYHSKEYIRNLWVTIANGNVWRGEMKNKAKDGTIYWVETTIVPFLDTEGKPYKYLAIRSDITERMIYVEKLKANEEKYHDLFENSLVPMFITDPKTRKTNYVNDKGISFLGYKSREDFIENYNSLNHFMYPLDLHKMRNDIEEFGIVKWNVVKMKKLDGTIFSARLVAKLSSDKSFVQTALIDVTDQIRSQQELEKKVKERTIKLTDSLIREKKLHDLTSNFVSIASHEFRTPLATILSSVSIIEMYPDSNQQPQRIKHVNLIASTIQNLTSILTNFLTLGELDNENIISKNVEIDLKKFINIIKEEMHSILKNKNQQFIYSHSGEAKIVQSEKILRNILFNLISNASKYSPIGESILITSTITNGHVSITVKDNGIGIPLSDQDKLFSQFFRAKNAENIQGTGLGLNIVKKYLELINGTINFTSKLDEGTTFTIQFPESNLINN